jgi:hypothetical protein
MGNPSDNFNLLAADLNEDGEVDIFDVVKTLNLALRNNVTSRNMARGTSDTEEPVILTATANGVLLDINNASRFTAFQFDVEVADGVELTETHLTANTGNHKLYNIKNGENTYRVIGISMDNSTLTDNGHGLIELSFSKVGHVHISNIVFVTPQETKVHFTSSDAVVTGIGSSRYQYAEEIFDLSGRKIDADQNRMTKGVYIINNKKVIIK